MKRVLIVILSVIGAIAGLVLVLRIYGYSRPIIEAIPRVNLNGFSVIAHRGGGEEAPENTLYAFRRVKDILPNVILEMDVRPTSEEIPVVIHDETVNRTTNGMGEVKSLSIDQLKKLDASSGFKNLDAKYLKGESYVSVPKFDEVLKEFRGSKMIVEIKSKSTSFADKVAEVIKKNRAQDRIIVSSEHPHIVERLRKNFSDWTYAAHSSEVFKSLLLSNLYLESLAQINSDYFCVPENYGKIPVLTQPWLKEVKRRNKRVFIWTVNKAEEMKRLINMGVDGIITDKPSQLNDIVNSIKKI